MKSTHQIRTLASLGLAITLMLIGPVMGGSVTVSPALTDDASTGISSSKTYTHTVSGGTAATINGVAFDLLDAGNTPTNFDWNTNGFNKNQIACCNNGDWDPAAGGVTGPDLINLLGSFTFSGNGDGNPASQTFTLSGLTPGVQYDTRAYIRVWDTEGSGRPIDVTFTNGGIDMLSMLEDRPSSVIGAGSSDQNAYYVSYQFTAETDSLVIDKQVADPAPSGSFHLYALSNEVVPEPSSIVMVGFCCSACCRSGDAHRSRHTPCAAGLSSCTKGLRARRGCDGCDGFGEPSYYCCTGDSR